MKPKSAGWTRGTVSILLRSYKDDGTCREELEALRCGDFALVKHEGARFPWNLTWVPTGQMIGLFRLVTNAKACAEKMKDLMHDKAAAAEVLKTCQYDDLLPVQRTRECPGNVLEGDGQPLENANQKAPFRVRLLQPTE